MCLEGLGCLAGFTSHRAGPELLLLLLLLNDKSCLTLCDPTECNMPSSSVLHYLPEFAQIHIHWVWCYLDISSSSVPFSSCPQPSPASRSLPVNQLFTSGGQSIGASASVLPMNIQDWLPLKLTAFISVQSKGLSRVFSRTTVFSTQKILFCLAALAGGPSNTFLI